GGESRRGGGRDQAAEAEAGENGADQIIGRLETLAQIGADEGIAPEQRRALDENAGKHDPYPWMPHERAELSKGVANGRRPAFDALVALQELARERNARDEEESGKKNEHHSPADVFGNDAGDRLTENEAEDLAGEKSRDHRLPHGVIDLVADPGDGERNDGRRRATGKEPRENQEVERGSEGAEQRGERRCERCDGNRLKLAEAVADQAV